MAIIARKGFTLMELLLVIGIVGILAAIVIIAINPTKQLDDAQDAERQASVREINNAVYQYIIDGSSFSGLPSTKQTALPICLPTVTGTDCTDPPVNGFDMSVIVTGNYLVDIPVDANETNPSLTGYYVYQDGAFILICSKQLDPDCGP